MKVRNIFLVLAALCAGIFAVSCSDDGGGDGNSNTPTGGGGKTTYTVTFDKNGGTGTMDKQTFKKDTPQALSANKFTRSGYTFLGWGKTKSATAKDYADGATITVSSDMTLYAVWKEGTAPLLTISDETVSLEKGKSKTITATLQNSTATISWTSDKPAIATVSPATGTSVTITAVSAGTATITATAGSLKKTCTVTVTEKQVSADEPTWTANFLDIVGGTAQSSDTVFFTTSSGYTATDPKSGYAEYAFGSPAALIVYSKGGLRSRKNSGDVNYNGGLTNELTTTVGTTLSDTIDRYVGIDISKLTSSGTVTVKFKGTAKPTSNNIQTDKPGQVVLIDQNGKILASQSDLQTNSKSTTYTNTSFSLTAEIDASEVTKVKLVFSRGGMACDKSSTDSTASTGGGIDVTSISANYTVGTPLPDLSSSGTISKNDKPIGFASVDAASNFGGKGGTAVTVKNSTDFKNYVKKDEAYIIYVDGMIDLSEGMLPTTAGGSTSALDSFVATKTSSYSGAINTTNSDTDKSKYYKFTSYNDFKTKYAGACSALSNDKNKSSPDTVYGKTLWQLNSDYQNVVKVNVGNNTTIIGVGTGSGVKGGTLNISSKSNIAIRNLTIQDAYDPFPHHEVNDAGTESDGFNAELDCIVIQGTSSNIWIDHCTLQDTLYASQVTISGGGTEKWQTFDGLCDIKNTTKNITISECHLYDHDKTMLIGNTDSDGSNKTRTISLIRNYFHNCGQRLPMVRNTQLHSLNNYYDASNPHYNQQYAIGNRAGALIFAEGNYFGSGIKYSIKDTYGKFYAKDNSDNSSQKTSGSSVASFDKLGWVGTDGTTVLTAPPYSYTPMTAAEAKTYVLANAGAGKWTVQQ